LRSGLKRFFRDGSGGRAYIRSRTCNLKGHGMTGLGWIAAIIVGGLAGWIAEKIMKSSMGLIMNIVLGIVGALVLNWILIALTGGTLGGWIGQLIVGIVGACILIAVARMIRRGT